MPVLAIVLLLAGSVVTVLALAVVLVLATDRLRALAERLLQVRALVEPAVADLRRDADEVSAHLARIQSAKRRPDDASTTGA